MKTVLGWAGVPFPVADTRGDGVETLRQIAKRRSWASIAAPGQISISQPRPHPLSRRFFLPATIPIWIAPGPTDAVGCFEESLVLVRLTLVAFMGYFHIAGAAAQSAPATPQSRPPAAEAARERARRLIEKGVKYLVAAQDKEGGWKSDFGPGITSLVLKALAQDPDVGPRSEVVRRGVEFVLKFQRDDGGIYSALGLYKNYETAVTLSMFSALTGGDFTDAIEKTRKFLIDNQADEDHGKSQDDVWYGGAGYSALKRPDLSNTQLMIEALHDSGLSKDDPAYRKALVFISRCQMHAEHNSMEFAANSKQGGFIYSAAGGGESKAGTITVDGRTELRSYGSMTYAGFKSMIYCGLSKDDARVTAALDWIRRNWTLAYNPNMPDKQSREGLFYFYHTFARALDAYGEPVIRDARGRDHDWRAELVDVLASQQRDDGSWSNEADRWMESTPPLATAYALLALQAAYPELTVAGRASPTSQPAGK